jgi:hypothetical protein
VRRNEAIHSAWSLTDATGKPAALDVISRRARRGTRIDLFPGGVPELEELARNTVVAERGLSTLHVNLLRLKALREEPRGGDDRERPGEGAV